MPINADGQANESPHLIITHRINTVVGTVGTFITDHHQKIWTFYHMLVTSTLQVDHVKALDFSLSDHLPVEMHITLPESVHLGS